MNRRPLAAGLALMVAGFAAESSALPRATADFATAAEGYTSEAEWLPMKVGFRRFSAPDFERLCDSSARPSRLAARYATMSIPLGEWFELSRLRVLAVDGQGRPLPPAPVALEVEQTDPSLFDLRSEMISDGRILPVREGQTKIRVRSLCVDLSAEVALEVSSALSFPGDWDFEAEAQESVVRARLLIEQVGTKLLATLLIDNHVLEGTVSVEGTQFEAVLAHADGSGPGHSEVLHLWGRLEGGMILGPYESGDGSDRGAWKATRTRF
jgi:hypothetical protein